MVPIPLLHNDFGAPPCFLKGQSIQHLTTFCKKETLCMANFLPEKRGGGHERALHLWRVKILLPASLPHIRIGATRKLYIQFSTPPPPPPPTQTQTLLCRRPPTHTEPYPPPPLQRQNAFR